MVDAQRKAFRIGGALVRYVVGVAAIAFFIFPLVWLLKASLNLPIDAITLPPVWLFSPKADNYLAIFREAPFLRFLRNSVLVGSLSTLLAIVIGMPAAYAFARHKFKGKSQLAFWVLSIFMFPPLATILPYLILFNRLQLVDTIPGLTIAHLGMILPIAVWLLQRFIREVPVELEEAAYVDGAGTLQRILQVIIPMTASGIAATAVFCFIFSWNDFIFALVLAPVSAKTLPVASVSLSSWAYINWGKISAACVIITAPVFALILVSRKYLVRGFTFGLK